MSKLIRGFLGIITHPGNGEYHNLAGLLLLTRPNKRL